MHVLHVCVRACDCVCVCLCVCVRNFRWRWSGRLYSEPYLSVLKQRIRVLSPKLRRKAGRRLSPYAASLYSGRGVSRRSTASDDRREPGCRAFCLARRRAANLFFFFLRKNEMSVMVRITVQCALLKAASSKRSETFFTVRVHVAMIRGFVASVCKNSELEKKKSN